MINLSSAMGGRFAELVTEITERIKQLGPSRIRLAKKAKTLSRGEVLESRMDSSTKDEVV